MNVPYIGITDFTNISQVLEMLRIFNRYREPGLNRRLHVGVMMSQKTLLGLPTKWADAMPRKETIADIFGSQKAMNCLHYADYEAVDVVKNLTAAIKWGGDGMTALQLDMCWPDPDMVAEAVLQSGQSLEVILQVGKRALEEEGNDPEKVVRRIEKYAHLVEYVLLDKSSGKGLGMDAEGLRPFIRIVDRHLPHVGVTVAGGLGPTSMQLVEPLLEEFPNLNIDAQGKLRQSGNALDPIDWNMAGQYLIRALDLFQRTATV